MNEEIDIIELLKRVKEGKAPKVIEIDSIFYGLDPNYESYSVEYWYDDDKENRWKIEEYTLQTKIKILDKPIIEELDYSLDGLGDATYNESWLMNCIRANKNKINEIIRHINKEGK